MFPCVDKTNGRVASFAPSARATISLEEIRAEEHCQPILFGNWNPSFFHVSSILFEVNNKGFPRFVLSNFVFEVNRFKFRIVYFSRILIIKLAIFSIDIRKL